MSWGFRLSTQRKVSSLSETCAVCLLPDRTQSKIVGFRSIGMGATAIKDKIGDEAGEVTIRNIEYHNRNCVDKELLEEAGDLMVRLADLIVDSGIDLRDIGKADKITTGNYQMLAKDADDVAHIHDLRRNGIVLSPKWETGPKWEPVHQAQPVKISIPKRVKQDRGGWKTAIILPDPQIGYLRSIQNPSSMTPFHDERALDIALQVIRHMQPDLIVNLGDFFDFAEFSHFLKEPGFALTTQPALDRGHMFLAQQRAAAGEDCEIRLIEGNHDLRLEKQLKINLASAFGIHRANLPDDWPVMSLPHLVRLDELGVEYIGGYPAGVTYINDRLACIHGSKVRSGGSTASIVVDDERVSVIFGHVHRIESRYKTRRVRDGGRVNFAATPGCLARIDGVVPSTKGGSDVFGRPVPAVEDWQQGLAIVTYKEGDGEFAYEPILIYEGTAIVRGERYSATVGLDGSKVEA